MATQPEVVKQSNLLHQLVLNRDTMEVLGRIELLWMYPKQHRVLGLICQPNRFSPRKLALKLSQVDVLGASGVLTHAQPEETDPGAVRQLETLIGCELWSSNGSRIGRIVDYCFDVHTGTITAYLWTTNSWSRITGDVYQLPPHHVLNMGTKRVLVSETIAQAPVLYQEGLQNKLTKMRNWLHEDYTQVSQDFQSFLQQAKALTTQTAEQAQSLIAQTKERVLDLGEQLKESTHNLVEQVQDRVEQNQHRQSVATDRWQQQNVHQQDTAPESLSTQSIAPTANLDQPPEDEDEPWI